MSVDIDKIVNDYLAEAESKFQNSDDELATPKHLFTIKIAANVCKDILKLYSQAKESQE